MAFYLEIEPGHREHISALRHARIIASQGADRGISNDAALWICDVPRKRLDLRDICLVACGTIMYCAAVMYQQAGLFFCICGAHLISCFVDPQPSSYDTVGSYHGMKWVPTSLHVALLTDWYTVGRFPSARQSIRTKALLLLMVVGVWLSFLFCAPS